MTSALSPGLLQTLGLEWNQLSGTLPSSLAALADLSVLAVSPGNYQLCGSRPPGARFTLCRQMDPYLCVASATLGSDCQQPLQANQLRLPAPARASITGLQVGAHSASLCVSSCSMHHAVARWTPACA